MKMIYCTCDVSILAELTELLEKAGIRNYQVLERVIAKNREGNPRLNTPVWPGYNSSVLMQLSEEEPLKRLMQAVKEYNAAVENKDELITVCAWTITDYIYD